MWALRRAANPLRSQSSRIVLAGISSSEAHIPKSEHKIRHVEEGKTVVGQILPKPSLYGPYISTSSFFWTRNLSSQAGRESNDEDDIEEGFSELETPLENEKDEDEPDKEEDLALAEDGSEEELDETAESVLGLSDVEVDSGAEKKKVKRSFASPLFDDLLKTPRNNINGVLSKWVEQGKPLGRPEIQLALLNLRKRRLYSKALTIFEWLEANKHIEYEERDYASHLDLVAKVFGIYKAERYLENIPQSFRGEIAYRTFLANCVRSGNIKKSEEVFNKMRDLGFPTTTFACNQLLILYKRHDRKKIPDVLSLMEKGDIKPSLFTFKLLVDAKGRAGDIEGMESVVELMKDQGMEPDLGTKATLAKYYILGNRKEKAEEVLKEMEGTDVKENRSNYKELLPLYASLNKADDVERIWKLCKDSPRLEECAAVIEALGKLGKVEEAEKVFEQMTKNWKKLSARYYNALLKVYANHKLVSKGKDLAKKMLEDGCRLGPLTLDALVKLYIDAEQLEKADSIISKAVQNNQVKPLYSTYLNLMGKYARKGDIHNSEKIFSKLRQAGYSGRVNLYQTLLQAYINSKTPAYGFKERMKADNMFPNRALAAQLVAVDGFKKDPVSELLDD